MTDIEDTWNVPGTAAIEEKSYDTVEFGALEADVSKQDVVLTFKKSKFEALFDMGFEDWEVYDCYMNHYNDYWWTELDELDAAVVTAFEALGWTSSKWNGLNSYPESEDKAWFELTEDEQRAAAELCYLPETWSKLDLEYWAVDYALLATGATTGVGQVMIEEVGDDALTSNDEPVITPVNNLGSLTKPANRFYVWDALPQEVLEAVESLGYTRQTWSNISEATIEQKRYKDLDVAEFLVVDSLGFGPANVYDCWISHYYGYSWAEIVAVGGECRFLAPCCYELLCLCLTERWFDCDDTSFNVLGSFRVDGKKLAGLISTSDH